MRWIWLHVSLTVGIPVILDARLHGFVILQALLYLVACYYVLLAVQAVPYFSLSQIDYSYTPGALTRMQTQGRHDTTTGVVNDISAQHTARNGKIWGPPQVLSPTGKPR